jgi:hypothetical protein
VRHREFLPHSWRAGRCRAAGRAISVLVSYFDTLKIQVSKPSKARAKNYSAAYV